MRIVREHINEKFTNDSDPIHDLGIGMPYIWKTLKRGDILRFKKTLRMNGSHEDTTGNTYHKGTYIVVLRVKAEEKGEWGDKEITYDYYNSKNKNFLDNPPVESSNDWTWDYEFFNEFFELVRRDLKESLNEKFTEDSDPVHDLGIGYIHLIEDRIKKAGYKNWPKNSYLIVCAILGENEYIKLLLDDGWNVHEDNEAALKNAILMNRYETVKILLEAGADVNVEPHHIARDVYEKTVLQYAKEEGDIRIVKLILKYIAKSKLNK
jgi:hypothetical protein